MPPLMISKFGNYVRIVPLKLEELPSHPVLDPPLHRRRPSRGRISNDLRDNPGPPRKTTQIVNGSDASTLDAYGRPNLLPFIKAVLEQAVTFVDEILPATFKPVSKKLAPPAKAKVQLLKLEVTSTELREIPWFDPKVPREMPDDIADIGETWFARKSLHENCAEKGTALFSEFDYGIRIDHPQHERDYTPNVIDAWKVLSWNIPENPAEEGPVFKDYQNVSMSRVYEMCHKLPFPMATRVFPVLVISAKTGASGFIVVQIPVHIKSLAHAFYSNGRNVQEGNSSLKRKKPVLGVYTSIERCVLRASNEVEWTMATASDAKGWIPLWTQKVGVPGAITKDVGFLMNWIEEQRKQKGP